MLVWGNVFMKPQTSISLYNYFYEIFYFLFSSIRINFI